ncbi:AAA family ATPase [Nocardioides ungokensis]|uniref:AAA family ATPase n=1 Tax=Nocardioides ungokensis TaxID=1643322 RepID=UPI001FEA0D71|nr:AAA family ATPase [Nocardioides ungokensis]
MSLLLETEDPRDHRLALGAEGLLRDFNEAGVIEAADVHVARRVTELAGEDDQSVALAVALAVRAVRGGSVCVDLTTVAEDSGVTELQWPGTDAWLAALEASPLTGTPPVLRLLDDRLLYLDRYWREEEQVCADLLARPAPAPLDAADGPALETALDRVFAAAGYDEQRAAARIALAQGTTVLTGGPGTGKTTTVAALLALLAEQAVKSGGAVPRIALAAPTGKAAARLQQAVEEEVARLPESDRARLGTLTAVTLHRLLGPRPDTAARFRHHRENRLPHDVVVVDETSMVSLTMMARLLEAVRPEARLLLVGDPDQLASVEAGAVLADLVEGLGARGDGRIAALRTSHRFGESIRPAAGRGGARRRRRRGRRLARGGRRARLLRQRARPRAPDALTARAAGARPGPRRRAR